MNLKIFIMLIRGVYFFTQPKHYRISVKSEKCKRWEALPYNVYEMFVY